MIEQALVITEQIHPTSKSIDFTWLIPAIALALIIQKCHTCLTLIACVALSDLNYRVHNALVLNSQT